MGKALPGCPVRIRPERDGTARHRRVGWRFAAEFDALGKGHTVAAADLLEGRAREMRRSPFGPYAHLGFGKSGILAEHDITNRTYLVAPIRRFRQNATYCQFFWATREWLVLSLIGEKLKVGHPFAEQLVAAKIEVAARLTSNVTITAGPRLQRNVITGQVAPSAMIQLALKPVLSGRVTSVKD